MVKFIKKLMETGFLMNKKYFTIKEVSKILGVTPLTLRNWDKKGKLKAIRHPINNYRLYPREKIEFLLRKIERQKKIQLG